MNCAVPDSLAVVSPVRSKWKLQVLLAELAGKVRVRRLVVSVALLFLKILLLGT